MIRARARVALVSALFATFAIGCAVATSAVPAATAVVIERVVASDDGERVTLDATTRGTTLSLTLRRDSEIAAGARIQAWGGEDGTGSVDGDEDEDENARLEALRRCSYGGEATDGQGRTLRAFGTVCHGRLRVVVVQPDDDLLTIRGELWKPSRATRSTTSGRMLGVEEIDVAAVTNGESWSLSDELEQLPVLDEDGDAVLLPDQPVASVDGDASSNGTRSRKLLTSSDNVVELVFWASRDRMVTMSENVNAFIEETILQVKVMQTFYDKTGFNPRIRLELKHFLYTPSGSTDPWGYYQSSSLVSMLPAVGTWTRSNPAQLSGIGWDALVITLPRTVNHYGPVGYAYMGKICTDQSVSVNAIRKDMVLNAAVVIAHELGHNIGFAHDGQSNYGTSSCHVDNFIMGPVLQGGEIVFSQCSIQQYDTATFRESNGVLYSVDQSCLTTQTAICGNGIREAGEQCDCYNNDCSVVDPGCNGVTCQLQTGKTCSKLHDKCCNIAQTGPAAAGTVCRAAVDAAFNIPCDIAETCNGTSVSCPADAAVGNGVKCEDDQGDVGSCFNGVCENREKACNGATPFNGATYHGGKWATAACASQMNGYGASPYHTFDSSTCTKLLYCTTVRNSCSVGGNLWYMNGNERRRDGFPCSTVAADGTFPSVCYNGVCTATSSLPSSTSPTGSAGPTPAPVPSPPPSPPPPSPPPAAAGTPSPPPPSPPPPILTAPNNALPPPPPRNSGGGDVSNSGIVKFVYTRIKLTGYVSGDFNSANQVALKAAVANYLNLASGSLGVSLLDVTNARRRRLLIASAASVDIKILLTASDSQSSIINALDTSVPATATAMKASLSTQLPLLTQVDVTQTTVSQTGIDENYGPQSKEEVEVAKFGYGIIVGLLIVIFVTPALLFVAAIALGPTSRLGRVLMVLIGEGRYAAFRVACCFASVPAEVETGRGGAPKVMTPAPREAPQFKRRLFGR